MTPLPPGSTIGILGGGQLGRMTAIAATELGYRTHVLTPEQDSPAGQVATAVTIADYADPVAAKAFAAAVDVITYEFENIPAAPVERLAEMKPVRPSPRVLAICQERVAEKDFVTALGIGTAPYRAVGTSDGLAGALAAIGRPAILKSARMGYDGKGQAKLGSDDDESAAWRAVGGGPAILEGFVAFAYEASIIVARSVDGTIACYEPVENRHVNHILAETIVPAPMAAATRDAADRLGRQIAEALDLVGLVCVELFVTPDGRLLVNEMAPRPHNSGHWTLDACATSQFEQLVRAIAGLPLGSIERLCDAVMENLIGDQVDRWPEILREPMAKLHLYGKAEARPGRKMGHVTRLKR